ncbi:MAG TPA: hypothetical protein VID94_18770 [Acidimicrobiales bacterium]
MSEPGPDLASRLEDIVHVGLGLSILAFQKAQVHRQDLKKVVRTNIGPATETLRDYVKVLEERLQAGKLS